jgi:glucose dehydrogenase
MDHVCVIGAGPAGCAVALRLARHGIRTTVLESGPRYSQAEKLAFFRDWVTSPRPQWNPFRLKQRSIEAYRNAGRTELPLDAERVRGLGGTSLFWLGNCPRMLPDDLRMRSAFGLAEDWPIGYDELEPYYAQAEAETGIAGALDNPFAGPRSTPYPMPPIPFSYADKFLKRTTDRLGIEFHHTPQARNSVPYGGREPCRSFSLCWVCPVNARATFDLTHAELAEQTGKVRFVTDVTALRIEVDGSDRARRVVYAGLDRVEQALDADVFVLAGGGIETPRLLLLSASRSFPDGLANRSGRVGRYLMNHPIAQVSGRVDASLFPYRVGFESTESFQFYATRTRDEVGAFLMNMNNADGVGGTPAEIARRIGSARPTWGDELARQVQGEFGRFLSLSAGVEQLPDERNTVTLDPESKDYFGQPIPRIHYGYDDYTKKALEKAAEIESGILRAAGATEVIPNIGNWWPGHHMGTTRMGQDPRDSVVDPFLRCHDVSNLYLVSTSCYVTGGAANPTLTLVAFALRTADRIARGA